MTAAVARLKDIVIDCTHPASLARFWADALHGYSVAPYDAAEIARLHALGIDDIEDDPTVLVDGPAGAPRVFLQRVPEGRVGKNRLHLDLTADDPNAELVRLLELGASMLADRRSSEHWVTLADPEGNEFCLMF